MKNFSDKIAVVTFLQENEALPIYFDSLLNSLKECCTVMSFVISSESLEPKEFSNYIDKYLSLPNETKFNKIKSALPEIKADYILFIDSDITIDVEALIKLVKVSINKKVDLSWGKIYAIERPGIIPKLIAVDKFLSHNIIRPFLWKIRSAITIPGQIFLIKRETMQAVFEYKNTYLDDIAVGMYFRKNKNLQLYTLNQVVGLEEPATTLKKLFKQRKRWAHGYTTMLGQAKENNCKAYIILHGFSYHGLWLLNFLLMLLFFSLSIFYGFLFLIFITSIFCSFKPKYFLVGFLYVFFFPALHVYWYINFLKFNSIQKRLKSV